MVGAYDADELVFRHSTDVMVDMIALSTECSNRILTNILENEEAEVIILNWMKDFGLTDKSALLTTFEVVMEGGRSGRDRNDNRSTSDGDGIGHFLVVRKRSFFKI